MYRISSTCQMANIGDLYAKHFGYKNNGVFVEVGAHDGYSWSNTWGLAMAGWRGLMFEPISTLFHACVNVHKANNVKVINACVGDRCGTTTLWLGANPTIDHETMEKSPWGDKYDPQHSINAPVVTLDYQLAAEEWPEEFDLLCIDVEGAELQVLRGVNLLRWKPKLLIVETHEGNVDSRKSLHSDAISAHIARLPYTKIQTDGLNTVWLRN